MLPVAGRQAQQRRAFEARYGRPQPPIKRRAWPLSGTQFEMPGIEKKPTGSGCLWVNLLVKGYCGVKPAGLTRSPVVVPTCLTDPSTLADVSLLTADKLSPGFR